MGTETSSGTLNTHENEEQTRRTGVHNGTRHSYSNTQPAPDARPLRWWSLIVAVIAAVVVAGAVYVVSKRLPATYQASGTFRVTVPNQIGINDSVVTAANDLASQYAQLATAQPVQAATAATLGVPPSTLNGKITASTVAAQNVVQVNASGPNASVATARAQAATQALATYIQSINSHESRNYGRLVSRGLGPINAQIGQVQARLKNDDPNQRQSDLIVLGSLIGQHNQAIQSVATNTAGGQPSVQVVSPGGGAAISYPKPSLYALIGFIVALLIALRLAYVLGNRHREAPAIEG
jgi:hypothetical protein